MDQPTEYTESTSELNENPDAKRVLLLIANGDQNAFQFMWRFWNFSHVLDDLIDRDKRPSQSQVFRETLGFVEMISFNPFYQTYKGMLFPMIVSCCMRCVVADSLLEKGSYTERQMVPAIKGGDVDLYSFIAYLTGGWDYWEKIDSEIRKYDQ